MMVVLVSTSDPGLEIFPTHRLFRGHDEALPSPAPGDLTPLDDALAQLAEQPFDRSHAVLYRRGVATPVSGEPGELDVELVDRLVGHEGLGYTADAGEAAARVDAGRVRRRLPAPRHPHRGRLRARAARRGDAPEDDLLLPEAHERPPLPPGMTVDWLRLCRDCVADIAAVLETLPTRVEREPVLRAGEGGDDTTAIDAAAEEAVVARLEALGADFMLVSEELGVRQFGAGGPVHVVVDPIDGSVNAKRGIPFFSLSLAVAGGPCLDDVDFGFVHDFGSGEEWVAERGRGAQLDGRPLESPGPKDPIEILSFEATTTAYIAERAPALVGSARASPGDGLARALALPSRGRACRRRLLAEAGTVDRHRRGPAARARARLRNRAVRRSATRDAPRSTSSGARESSLPRAPGACAEIAAALSGTSREGRQSPPLSVPREVGAARRTSPSVP